MSRYDGVCPNCGEWAFLLPHWEAYWCKECITDEAARIQAEVEVDIEKMEEAATTADHYDHFGGCAG